MSSCVTPFALRSEPITAPWKSTPATELGAAVVRETLRRSKLDPARVGSVVMGNVIQAGNRMNPARQAAINGGIPSLCRR